MRQIEFRAKDENNEWHYGFLTFAPGNGHYVIQECVQTMPTMSDPLGDGVSIYTAVKHDSIGQFTGLLDKNGVKIWEGDKFQDVFSDNIGVVKFGSYHHCFDDKRLIEFGAHVGFYVYFESGAIRKDLDYWAKNREVIGNIHDQVSKEGGEP